MGAGVLVAMISSPGWAGDRVFDEKSPSDQNNIIYGGRGVSGRSAVAGVCSLILPGIGQAVNENAGRKVAVHAVVGLIPLLLYTHPVGAVFLLFHVWSGWDALIDRRGGYINGTVSVPTEWLDSTDRTPGVGPASC